MAITTTCPNCKARFRLADEMAEKKVRCQKCNGVFDSIFSIRRKLYAMVNFKIRRCVFCTQEWSLRCTSLTLSLRTKECLDHHIGLTIAEVSGKATNGYTLLMEAGIPPLVGLCRVLMMRAIHL